MATAAKAISCMSESALERPVLSPTQLAWRRFWRHKMAVFGLFLRATLVVYVVGGSLIFSEDDANYNDTSIRLQGPSRVHPFGTDVVGRDILARTIYGGQISLAIGGVSVVISILLGTLVGLVSGYLGGWVDAILSRITEALLAIPALVLLLTLSTVLSQEMSTINFLGRELSATVIVIVAIIGFTSWMNLSRIVRSLVLSFKEQEFIIAAKAIGSTNSRILFRHILPNCLAPIIVAATLGIGTAIITEAYLSFLGFGVRPPTATWGNILTAAQNNIETRWWLWMIPGVFIVATVLAINFIGDGLRDALDPRSIR